ncbi:MAG: UDP-N-acetylmuramoylalanyl-D-glutamyl-2, 6-diaminopimelate--D-alanyl-D-alanine ligase [Candidatus Liberibacter europaeus]|uniref:UDP-N-acetylmuramoyl-tripeptide--D-alanyl-D-alanine ligase n=1 Tax=Candidatus Liberibacter europaeus TaxID=744859 RepID=A0A2T4VWK7_9HYPH|nr:UDP-N-acetylmuramoylalanyl-D-glutamyl-2, 6-diaminopimelate--D-alanyl-D-alanine ligase [Candidatus Liberibacter europaeus]PTL86162.1 MAG: UDP-N-acetylmuramoylalanyl-D-glutamyl-2, 6-diaminopimelate--D-alanyl-D-alanine ligase [Candidatus Liberibacter europaeus]
MNRLWNLHDLLKVIQGKSLAKIPEGFVTGISIDSRTISPGEAFFALKGDRYDGHDYVLDAVEKKAALVIINTNMLSSIGRLSVPVFLVNDVLSALKQLAIAARLRSKAKVIAITGSVGKTTTKEMINLALSAIGKTHVCESSYNNHIGVPLTLSRMPDDAEFAIFELGMSHPGDIRFLTQLVRPDLAVITTIAPAHIGNFSGLEEIASSKAEIFEGLEKTGSVLLNHDNHYFEFLKNKSNEMGIGKVYSFGKSVDADFRMLKVEELSEKSCIRIQMKEKLLEVMSYATGQHMAYNILATLGVVLLLDSDINKAINALSDFHPLKGRGKRYHLSLANGYFTLIDESYNANPASMQAAIAVLSQTYPYGKGRRIAVLGDMNEMGKMSESFHINLAKVLLSHNISHVWLTGMHMMALKESLPRNIDVQHFENMMDLLSFIKLSIIEGDIMVVKSSHACRLYHIVQLLLEEFKLIH